MQKKNDYHDKINFVLNESNSTSTKSNISNDDNNSKNFFYI